MAYLRVPAIRVRVYEEPLARTKEDSTLLFKQEEIINNPAAANMY